MGGYFRSNFPDLPRRRNSNGARSKERLDPQRVSLVASYQPVLITSCSVIDRSWYFYPHNMGWRSAGRNATTCRVVSPRLRGRSHRPKEIRTMWGPEWTIPFLLGSIIGIAGLYLIWPTRSVKEHWMFYPAVIALCLIIILSVIGIIISVTPLPPGFRG